MAGYGSARTYAELLKDAKGARLLDITLNEEEAADLKLTKLAKSVINLKAEKAPTKTAKEKQERKSSGGVRRAERFGQEGNRLTESAVAT